MNYQILKADISDAQAILDIQRAAYQIEAELYDNFDIPPLTETLEDLEDQFSDYTILKAVVDDKLVGTVRAYEDEGICHIGRLAVDPAMHRQGIGTALMNAIEQEFYADSYELFAGEKSVNNIKLYEKLGYEIFKTGSVVCGDVKVYYMRKEAL